MPDHELNDDAFNLSERVRKEAVALDKLENGALVAVIGGATALGVMFGGLWWVLVSAAGSLGLYRMTSTFLNYKKESFSRKLEKQTEVTRQIERLNQAQLPQLAKDEMTRELLGEVIKSQSLKSLPAPASEDNNR